MGPPFSFADPGATFGTLVPSAASRAILAAIHQETMIAVPGTRRRLAARMTGVFLALAALSAGITLYLDVEAVDDRVVAVAEEKTRAFFASHRDKLASPWEVGVRSQLQELAEELLDNRFIVVEFYDRAARPLAEATRAQSDDVESAVHLMRHEFPVDAKSFYKRHFIAGAVYVQVFVPIIADDGRRIGFFEGIYQVDGSIVDEFRLRLVWSLALALLAALAGTLLIHRAVVARRPRPSAS